MGDEHLHDPPRDARPAVYVRLRRRRPRYVRWLVAIARGVLTFLQATPRPSSSACRRGACPTRRGSHLNPTSRCRPRSNHSPTSTRAKSRCRSSTADARGPRAVRSAAPTSIRGAPGRRAACGGGAISARTRPKVRGFNTGGGFC